MGRGRFEDGREGSVTPEAEMGMMWPQPRNAGSHQKLEETETDSSLDL